MRTRMLLLASALCVCQAAAADTFWEFTGVVSVVDDPDSLGSALVGEPASGWFSFDSTAPNLVSPNANEGDYDAMIASFASIGPDTYYLPQVTGANQVQIWNDIYFPPDYWYAGSPEIPTHDLMRILMQNNTGMVNGVPTPPTHVITFSGTIAYDETDHDIFSDATLPTTPPDLAESVQPRRIVVDWYTATFIVDLTSLPEPSHTVLLVSGAIALAALSRSRKS